MTPGDPSTPSPGPKSVLFHVGLPKAGSSFLQRRVFPEIADATFVQPSSDSRWRQGDGSSAAFLRDPEAARQVIAGAAQAKVIVSAEGFVGDPYDSFRDHAEKAAGMKAVWPDAAILLVIRRQDRLCSSLFGQALRKGFPYAPARFLLIDGSAEEAGPGSRHFDYRAADFDRLVMSYEDLFGESKVFVLPLEQLAEAPAAFLGTIREIQGYEMDLPKQTKVENRAYSKRSYRAARLLNRLCLDETVSGARLFAWLEQKAAAGGSGWRLALRALRAASRALKRRVRRTVEWVGRGNSEAAEPLNEDQLGRIREHFAASNRRLSERKGLHLERYGYF